MAMLKIDNELADKLALSLTQKPRANLQQLAAMVGISKATLYRIVPTREQLIEALQQQAEQHIREALSTADLSARPYQETLRRLINHILLKKELYIFWTLSLWMDLGDDKPSDLHGYNVTFLTEALEDFFLKGQQAGIFRVDMPAAWLAKSLDYMLYAAAESSQRGEIALLKASELVEKMFTHGAAAG